LCDVDSRVLDKRGAEYPAARKYTDFRKMIGKEKLDGVIVAVPDHNHAYISVWAMKHGLHVYCQKPLTPSVHEARIMARVAAETKVVTQMGTQTSAEPRHAADRGIDSVRGAGRDHRDLHDHGSAPSGRRGWTGPEGEDAVPPELDWDLWLGHRARPAVP
jgi:predicted dehydrogenase